MKVIDRTPFLDQQGSISVVARVQGTLKFGPNWFPETEAQRPVIAQLDRLLDKGFALIRNFTLPGSDIIIPMILIGPGSMTVILASPVKGQFEAKETEWNTVSNGVATPAKRNLIDLLLKLRRAFQKYLEINNINTPFQVDAVLIAIDPGANIESIRPAVRVLRSDAIKQFANSLNQTGAVLRAEQVLALADLIIEPQPSTTVVQEGEAPPPQTMKPVEKRAPAAAPQTQIPNAAPKAPPKAASNAAPKAQPAQPARKKTSGISRSQIILLAGLGIVECCVVIAGAFALFYLTP